VYDFIIIGSGIIGLSVGMTLAQRHPKIHIVILKRQSNLLTCYQFRHNSGVTHPEICHKPEGFKANKFTTKFLLKPLEYCNEPDILAR
jgi:(S)-2-hydroxyglutarate dehydrogenase